MLISRYVLFCEDTCWDWSEGESAAQKLTLEVENEETNTEASTEEQLPVNTKEPISSSDEETPRRYKTLSELYDTCSFALSVTPHHI